MKKTIFPKAVAAVSCLAAAMILSGCVSNTANAVPEEPPVIKNSCAFESDYVSYYKVKMVEEGISVVRKTTLKGDSLVSVSTYEGAPYSFLASECSGMEGADVRCEGNTITAVAVGSPENLELSFKLSMEMGEALCDTFSFSSK